MQKGRLAAQLLIVAAGVLCATAALACPPSMLFIEVAENGLPDCVPVPTECADEFCETSTTLLSTSGSVPFENQCEEPLVMRGVDCPYCGDPVEIQPGDRGWLVVDYTWADMQLPPEQGSGDPITDDPYEVVLGWELSSETGEVGAHLEPDLNLCGEPKESGCSTAGQPVTSPLLILLAFVLACRLRTRPRKSSMRGGPCR